MMLDFRRRGQQRQQQRRTRQQQRPAITPEGSGADQEEPWSDQEEPWSDQEEPWSDQEEPWSDQEEPWSDQERTLVGIGQKIIRHSLRDASADRAKTCSVQCWGIRKSPRKIPGANPTPCVSIATKPAL
jgi:hypothetical protein